MSHIPVLLKEVIESLDIRPGDTVVDGTLGGGGHTQEILSRFANSTEGGAGNSVRIIGIDRDADAISRVRERLEQYAAHVTFVEGNFRDISQILDNLKIEAVDKILLDVGLSSDQFESSGRGFSFQKEEPLLMTFNAHPGVDDLTAREIVNTWDEENIRTIIKNYGEEKFAGRIARGIVEARALKPISTTKDLADVIIASTPAFYHRQRIHPATRTFQALRITVNDEIESLKQGIRGGFEKLALGGRMAVISFHSLEDREVKQFFKKLEDERACKRITKKPIGATDEEIERNPRSRSAKLRVIEKL